MFSACKLFWLELGRQSKFAGVVAITLLLSGCYSGIKQTYYLAAYDEGTSGISYYKIGIDGDTYFSKSKFSVGLYDRNAVERLFGENGVSYEYLSTSVQLYDFETGKKLKDIDANLNKAKVNDIETRKSHLSSANAAISEMLERYKTKLSVQGKLLEQFQQSLNQAGTYRQEGQVLLEAGNLLQAEPKLRAAQAIIEAIRIAVDGKVLVRFFDGAGNELDVATKSMVIFVASDISRFSEAIRQLAESEQVTQDIMRIVLGPRIQQAQTVKTRVISSNRNESALVKLLDSKLEQIANCADIGEARGLIMETAATVGEKAGKFKDAEDIRSYVKGMEVMQ